MDFKEFKTTVNGIPLTVKTSQMADQTNGSVLAQYGETTVLATVVMGNVDKMDSDNMPLSVDYEEKYYAAGKIYGSRFLRRESRPSEVAILTSRMIDRTIRPLFNPYLRRDVQVNTICLSIDESNEPDILGIIAASTALLVSDVPWGGPVGAIRIGYKNDNYIINPTYKQQEEGLDFEMVLSGIPNKINMIEFQGNEIKEELIKKAFEIGTEEINKICAFELTIQKEIGKEKAGLNLINIDEAFRNKIKELCKDKMRKAFFDTTSSKLDKNTNISNLIKETLEILKADESNADKLNTYPLIIEELENELLHEEVLNNNLRPDGRGMTEIRPIDMMLDVIPRTHGNALFVRGQTQTLTTVTLGAPTDTLMMQGMEVTGEKRYMHHYNFPQWSVGEVGRSRGPGRREIGHGALAEKALMPMIPKKEDFPYAIRVVSEVMASNGSSSMASTCSSTLSLMAAGVPIKAPVAGIAMGVIIDEADDSKYQILTDIQGPEDHYGDMDFKVAGTRNGVNALQLDVKVNGIGPELLEKALVQAKDARFFILDKIEKVIKEPRKEVSKYAPKIIVFKIDPLKTGEVIGTGGKTINKIIEQTGVAIDIEDGVVYITGIDLEMVNKAKEIIEGLIKEYKEGDIVNGTVTELKDFGAIVYFDGDHSGLLHISELANRRVNFVSDVVKVGDNLTLKIKKVENGKISLSLKDMQNK